MGVPVTASIASGGASPQCSQAQGLGVISGENPTAAGGAGRAPIAGNFPPGWY